MATQPWGEALAIVDAKRGRPRSISAPPGKGRPPLRQCPDDFEIIFIEMGRDNVEVYFRASRISVNRWLDELGKDRLIALRAAFVRHQRGKFKRPKSFEPPANRVRDRRRISPTLARHAAHFLRAMRNGGWIVSLAQNGDWWVGCRRRSPAELVDFAKSKGFDPNVLGIAALLDQAYGEPR